MNRLKTLWRKAFPIRLVLVYRDRADTTPSSLNALGDAESFDAMLPELVDAYITCAPMFKWLAMEIARKDRLYHALPPHGDPVAYATWQRTIEGLNAQIAILNRAIRVPLLANQRIIELQKLAETRKATEAEREAIENFFTE